MAEAAPTPGPTRRLNGLRWGALALIGILCVAGLRVWLDGRNELAMAARLQIEGDLHAAVEHYAYAMRWYTPLAGAPSEAADALWDIADDATGQGDRPLAMKALRRLRGGILATRGLHCPFCDLLDPVNQKLAVHIADEQLELGQPTIRGRSRTELVADHLALLRLDPIPHRGWSLLAIFGFFGWVAGGFLLAFRGFDVELKRSAAFAPLLGLTLVGFAGWLVGLWLA